MTTCHYWNWAKFAFEILESHATQELKYLPPRPFCTVEYPVRLKNYGKWSDIYSRVAVDGAAGPFYVVDCKMWDSTGSTELLTTTFIVPRRDPGSNIDRFQATWDKDLATFIVRSTECPIRPSPIHPVDDLSRYGRECRQHGDDMFDIEYLSTNHGLYFEDQSQYDLGVFAVRETVPISEKPSKECAEGLTPEPSSSKSGNAGEIDIEELLKPDSFDWADEVDCTDENEQCRPIDNKTLLKPDPFDWADEIECELESKLPHEIEIDTLLKSDTFDWADDVEAEIERKAESTQQTVPSSKIGLESLLKPDSFNWADEVELEMDHKSDIEKLLKPESFDWADEAEPDTCSGSDIENLLKPDFFDWADEVEIDNAPLTTPQLLPTQNTTTLDDLHRGAAADGDDENSSRAASISTTTASSTTPTPTPDTSLIVSSDACRNSSRPQHSSPKCTNAGYDCSLPITPGNDGATYEGYGQPQASEAKWLAENEIAWQIHLTALYPYIHHFNWLGEPVTERSYTSPEVSLFVILTGPKACFTDATRAGVVLKEAQRFIDPVLYAGAWDALSCYGHEFLKAITGCVYPFYTEAGTWQEDPKDCDDVEPICDPISPSVYASHPSIPFNGWFSTSVAPVRTQFWDASARISSSEGHGRRGSQPFRRSPLRKCIFAGSGKVRFVKGKAQYLAHDKQPTTSEEEGSSSDSSQLSPPSTGRTTPVSDDEEQPVDWRKWG